SSHGSKDPRRIRMQEYTGLDSLPSESSINPSLSSSAASTLQALAVWSPLALFELADLAVAGVLAAEQQLLSAIFDLPSYLEFAAKDVRVLPRLAILAELGCENIQVLLARLVVEGPQDFFFSIAGVAGEGARTAFSILNQTASFDHLAALTGFADSYG